MKLFRIVKLLLACVLTTAPAAYGASLPDVCATQGSSSSLSSGTPICVTNNGTAWLSIGNASSASSIAISTGHGTGDLSLYVDQGRWPSTASNSNAYKSLTAGTNTECVVISNPNQY